MKSFIKALFIMLVAIMALTSCESKSEELSKTAIRVQAVMEDGTPIKVLYHKNFQGIYKAGDTVLVLKNTNLVLGDTTGIKGYKCFKVVLQ